MSFKTKYIDYDIEKIIKKADLDISVKEAIGCPRTTTHGVCIIEEGSSELPFGNGSFATPVQTDGRKISMQLAHTDYLPFGDATTARTVDLEADYACGIAYFDIDFGEDVLSEGNQYVKYYEGICGYKSEKMDISMVADRERNLLCIKVIDKREEKKPFDIILKSPRTPLEINKNHTTEVKMLKSEENVILDTFSYEECDTGVKANDIYCRATVGVEVEIKPTKWHCLDYELISMQTFKITVNPFIDIRNETCDEITIYIGASVTHDKNFDTQKDLINTMRFAKKTSYELIEEKTKEWFKNFWDKSFIQLDESKKWLDATTILWIKMLYCMALTKYGEYPPLHQVNPLYGVNKCNVWRGVVWFNNARYEYAMNTINHPEMNEPLFKMIKTNYAKYENLASQYWGSKGIHIPEGTCTDGREIFPDEFTKELRDWYVKGIIPSEKFHDILRNRGYMGTCDEPLREGHYTMRFGYDTCNIAELYRMRYLYNCDEDFLKNIAYPILKDAAEFYRNNEILQKKEDGKYHIFPTNYAESYWGATDVIDDVAMIKGLFPIVADYAEKLNVDSDLVPLWREVAENMCDFVTADDEDCISPRRTEDGKAGFAMCREPHFDVAERMGVYQDSHPLGCPQDEQIRPVMDYDLVTHETDDDRLKELCMNTLEGNLVIEWIKKGKLTWCLDRFGTNCARLGRTDLASIRLPHQYSQIMGFDNITYDELKNFNDLDNAYDVLKYKNIFDLQYWVYEESIMECLIGCCPKKDDKSKNVIYIAPAWNMKNDAKFMLAARDGFDVCCEIKDQKVKVIEVYSKCGKPCVIKNTFDKAVTVEFPDGTEKVFDGKYIEFNTIAEHTYAIKISI